MALSQVTVTGRFLLPSGAAAAGQVTFTPSAAMQDTAGDTIVPAISTSATLSATGQFSVNLAATDSAGLIPTGITYHVIEQIAGASVRSYSIALPTTPTTVDLADLAPAVVTSPAFPYLLTADAKTVYLSQTAGTGLTPGIPLSQKAAVSGVASLGADGKVPTAQLPASVVVSDASTTAKGIVQLAGDLAGTAAAPTVPGLAAKADLVGGVVPDAQIPAAIARDSEVTGAVETHRVDSTDVHGIVDTAALALKTITTTTQTAAAYTLLLADAATLVETSNAAANTLTVPPNSAVPFAVGTVIGLRQYGAGQTTVAAGAGVTIRSRGGALKLAGQYAEASLVKRGADEWVLTGDVVV